MMITEWVSRLDRILQLNVFQSNLMQATRKQERLAVIPYVQVASDRVGRVLRRFNI